MMNKLKEKRPLLQRLWLLLVGLLLACNGS